MRYRKDEAIYYIKKLCWLSEVVIVASCLLVFVLTKPITMIGGMEAESAKLCMQMMIFITIVKPLCWVMAFVPGYGMRAAGDVKFSMITSCCTMWLCRVSLCIYLCRVWGFGTDRRLDRHGGRLEPAVHSLYHPVQIRKMAESSFDRRKETGELNIFFR